MTASSTVLIVTAWFQESEVGMTAMNARTRCGLTVSQRKAMMSVYFVSNAIDRLLGRMVGEGADVGKERGGPSCPRKVRGGAVNVLPSRSGCGEACVGHSNRRARAGCCFIAICTRRECVRFGCGRQVLQTACGTPPAT